MVTMPNHRHDQRVCQQHGDPSTSSTLSRKGLEESLRDLRVFGSLQDLEAGSSTVLKTAVGVNMT